MPKVKMENIPNVVLDLDYTVVIPKNQQKIKIKFNKRKT